MGTGQRSSEDEGEGVEGKSCLLKAAPRAAWWGAGDRVQRTQSLSCGRGKSECKAHDREWHSGNGVGRGVYQHACSVCKSRRGLVVACGRGSAGRSNL